MRTKLLNLLLASAVFMGMSACSDDDDAPAPVAVDGVTIDRTELTLEIGESATVVATVTPGNATDKTVTWASSDDAVATVDQSGVVTAVAAGQAVLTATAGDKSATCTVTVNPPFVAPNIGDFFYSDGTWSPDVDNSKTVIGIVFWAGDPSENDAKLREDHPSCTHGLVIGLDQKDVIAWQPKYESAPTTISEWVENNTTGYELPCSGSADNDPLQIIIGYNNTKAIEAYNAAAENAGWPVEVISWVQGLRSDLPAPANTSDWYIPSPKELSLLCAGEIDGNIYIKTPVMSNIDYINTRFAEIDQPQMDENTYWSSTENKGANAIQNEMAWNYYFEKMNRPLSYSFKAWSEYARVRAVLAF